MVKISKEEILKIAALSKLKLEEEEIPVIEKQMQDVLAYAARVAEVEGVGIDELASKNVNVFREDSVSTGNPETILAQAPEREGDYFVVPAIIEQN